MLRRLNKIPKCITFRQIVRNLCTPDDGPPPNKPCETDGKSGQTEAQKKPKKKVLRKKNEKCPPKIKRSQVGATKPEKHVKKAEKRSLPGKEVPLKAPYWRNLSLGVVAFIVCFTGYTFATIKEHERQPFVAYEYMRIRNKPYFFGDGSRTLFHNARVNALKDGYEDEEK